MIDYPGDALNDDAYGTDGAVSLLKIETACCKSAE